MPVVLPPTAPAGGAQLTGTPTICQFGNQPLPNGQGALGWINLNDLTNWQLQDFQADASFIKHSTGRRLWRAKGVFLGQDAAERVITLPMRYHEVVGPLGAALAQLSQAGQQYLSFDGVTGILCKYAAARRRTLLVKSYPLYWGFDLDFLAPTPWFGDLVATTPTGSPFALAGSVSPGTATNFTVTYAGSVFTEPVFTLTVPITNTVPIVSLTLENTMSLETLSIVFPGNLAASTAYTITIDCGAFTIVDQNGTSYDPGGTAFPMVYAPAGQANPFTATLVTASGTSTGVTLGASFVNRWEI